jgi:hypothetical protein
MALKTPQEQPKLNRSIAAGYQNYFSPDRTLQDDEKKFIG